MMLFPSLVRIPPSIFPLCNSFFSQSLSSDPSCALHSMHISDTKLWCKAPDLVKQAQHDGSQLATRLDVGDQLSAFRLFPTILKDTHDLLDFSPVLRLDHTSTSSPLRNGMGLATHRGVSIHQRELILSSGSFLNMMHPENNITTSTRLS